MSSSLAAQLASICYSVEELTTRISTASEAEREGKREDVANALEEIERSFRSGIRRLDRLVRDLDRR